MEATLLELKNMAVSWDDAQFFIDALNQRRLVAAMEGTWRVDKIAPFESNGERPYTILDVSFYRDSAAADEAPLTLPTAVQQAIDERRLTIGWGIPEPRFNDYRGW